ncbi:survival motor neuron protein-like isoform X2 [Dicentrarchus labrax]|uniref:Tudor domain-containing protein n=1 Tax=Dicentrarchus labrax TaxID=13489 RepID=A0A8P4K7L1_DICLA|nr:survival motor neuron protein-like isoform X2 [Dicentrarchus labrax]
MTELTENTLLHGAAEPEEAVTAVTAAGKDQTALTEVFKSTLNISQVVGPTAATEETDSRERQEQEDRQHDGQTDRQHDGQTDRQTDRQQDGQMLSPPTESKWAVGAQCRAVWSEDGQVYRAKVLSVDGGRCRVRFCGYGNEEEVELSALRSPEALQTHRHTSQDWRPGSRCRAEYSEDGLVYPAVVLWVKGQRCRVRYDDYNNEEEQEVDSLLNPDELLGPCRTTGDQGNSWRRRGENQERGAERRSVRRDDQHSSSWVKPSSQSKVENEDKKTGAEKPTNHSSSFFPPFSPPPQSSTGDPMSFIPPPPPPPLWAFGGKESAVSATSSMLMLWYMCGFHTGSYMAQQEFKSSSKD